MQLNKLKEIVQLPVQHTDSWYIKLIGRRISIYFTYMLLKTPLSANQATVLYVLIGYVACYFFATGGLYGMVIGAIFCHLFLIFDCVDGEIARYRKQTSLTGKYFDNLTHYMFEPLMFFSISLGLYMNHGYLFILIMGMLSAIFYSYSLRLTFDLKFRPILNEVISSGLDIKNYEAPVNDSSTFTGLISKIAKLVFGFGSTISIILLIAIFDFFYTSGFVFLSYKVSLMVIFIVLYGAIMPLIFLIKMYILINSKDIDQEFAKIKDRC
jgi:phosphatidylglycerophosphate synthase